MNAGFNKYWNGWPAVRLMNSIAKNYVDEANVKCEEEVNLRAEAKAKAKAAEEARVVADAKKKANAEEANVLAAKAKAAEEAKLAAEAEAMAEKEAKLNTEDGNHHVWGVNAKDEIYYRAP